MPQDPYTALRSHGHETCASYVSQVRMLRGCSAPREAPHCTSNLQTLTVVRFQLANPPTLILVPSLRKQSRPALVHDNARWRNWSFRYPVATVSLISGLCRRILYTFFLYPVRRLTASNVSLVGSVQINLGPRLVLQVSRPVAVRNFPREICHCSHLRSLLYFTCTTVSQ